MAEAAGTQGVNVGIDQLTDPKSLARGVGNFFTQGDPSIFYGALGTTAAPTSRSGADDSSYDGGSSDPSVNEIIDWHDTHTSSYSGVGWGASDDEITAWNLTHHNQVESIAGGGVAFVDAITGRDPLPDTMDDEHPRGGQQVTNVHDTVNVSGPTHDMATTTHPSLNGNVDTPSLHDDKGDSALDSSMGSNQPTLHLHGAMGHTYISRDGESEYGTYNNNIRYRGNRRSGVTTNSDILTLILIAGSAYMFLDR